MEGFAAGFEKALLEFNKKNNFLLMKMNDFLSSFKHELEELDKIISSRLVFLVMNIAKKITENTAYNDDQNLLKKIKEILKDDKIIFNKPTLFIHPDNTEIIEKHFKKIFSKYGWTIFYDKKISRGGCIVRSEDTILDSTIEGRWTELCRLVLKEEE
ncbi:MAG: flagellar assembly protein FliH [Buchnera aphidicola (Nurudea yanoniella)]